jgi:hypothetical protein
MVEICRRTRAEVVGCRVRWTTLLVGRFEAVRWWILGLDRGEVLAPRLVRSFSGPKIGEAKREAKRKDAVSSSIAMASKLLAELG